MPSAVDDKADGLANAGSWWYEGVRELPPATRQLFEGYAGVPAEEVLEHVETMRARAFKIFPYPCIGQHRFLNLTLSCLPLYPAVLDIMKRPDAQPPALLDVGCCLGQDLRKLVADGVPSERLVGLDCNAGFIKLGYELFRDQASFRARFCIADMFDPAIDAVLAEGPQADEHSWEGGADDSANRASPPESLPLLPFGALVGRFSVIVANSFLHLYDYGKQRALAGRMARLLRPQRGSLIVGRQVGSTVPGEYGTISADSSATRFAHDPETLRHFWEVEVAGDVGGGCRFRVEVVMDEMELGRNRNKGQDWAEPNIRRLLFGVWRE